VNLSVVIPVYNEAENINVVLRELFSVCKKIAGIDNLQVLVVDDHSSDGTFDIVNELNDSRITILRLSRRSGSHTALRAGIREAAAGDAVLCISADGQDDPFCLGEMLDKWRSGSHIVWALRKHRKKEPWYVRIPARLFYRLLFSFLRGEDNKIDLSRADFFLLDKKIIQAINACSERNTSLFGLIVGLGFMQGQVEYERRSRLSGRSKWNLRSLFSLSKEWVIAFSGIPLKIASGLGIVMAILGVLCAAYIVIDKIFFSAVIVGWASIAVLILVMGGIQLMILGMVGEYLWRSLEETRRRPLFFIEKRTNKKE